MDREPSMQWFDLVFGLEDLSTKKGVTMSNDNEEHGECKMTQTDPEGNTNLCCCYILNDDDRVEEPCYLPVEDCCCC